MTFFARPGCAVTRHYRYFSSSCLRRGQFTIAVSASTSKSTVLEKIRQSRDDQHKDNAALIVASPRLAAWLEDDAFVSSLVASLLPAATPQVSVLAAVVDGLVSSRQGLATEGLAVLHGDQSKILPGLWREAGSAASSFPSRGSGNPLSHDAEGALTFALPGLSKSEGQQLQTTNVTLPLANTIFQNGKRSTLLASQWQWSDSDDKYRLLRHPEERTHQHVHTSFSQSATSVSVSLLAVTAPRKIVAGLGNIVRQVALDGKPSPASRELESAIPALLAARRKANPALADGALPVWGLVIPQDVMPFYESVQDKLQPIEDHSPEEEAEAARKASTTFTQLLGAGCRLHRILSGGGGWGAKQGLLSLDPQMVHPASENAANEKDSNNNAETDSMESFLRSLRGEAVQNNDVAMAGAHVQFLVSPLVSADPAEAGSEQATTTILECSPPPPPQQETEAESATALTLLPSHFGALSNQGLFVECMVPNQVPNQVPHLPADQTNNTIRSKLDVPKSCISA